MERSLTANHSSNCRMLLLEGLITRFHYARWIEREPTDEDIVAQAFKKRDWKKRRKWRTIGEGVAKEEECIEVLYDRKSVIAEKHASRKLYEVGIAAFFIAYCISFPIIFVSWKAEYAPEDGVGNAHMPGMADKLIEMLPFAPKLITAFFFFSFIPATLFFVVCCVIAWSFLKSAANRMADVVVTENKFPAPPADGYGTKGNATKARRLRRTQRSVTPNARGHKTSAVGEVDDQTSALPIQEPRHATDDSLAHPANGNEVETTLPIAAIERVFPLGIRTPLAFLVRSEFSLDRQQRKNMWICIGIGCLCVLQSIAFLGVSSVDKTVAPTGSSAFYAQFGVLGFGLLLIIAPIWAKRRSRGLMNRCLKRLAIMNDDELMSLLAILYKRAGNSIEFLMRSGPSGTHLDNEFSTNLQKSEFRGDFSRLARRVG